MSYNKAWMQPNLFLKQILGMSLDFKHTSYPQTEPNRQIQTSIMKRHQRPLATDLTELATFIPLRFYREGLINGIFTMCTGWAFKHLSLYAEQPLACSAVVVFRCLATV
jgi:hypothetical protein